MTEPKEQVASLIVSKPRTSMQNRHVHNTTYLKYLFDAMIRFLPKHRQIVRYLSPLAAEA
ncbi:MAG: hypothetical protein MZU97_00190 [Bacillus subtilis]|nr:hypothetical protein [Bacillus subtilis]